MTPKQQKLAEWGVSWSQGLPFTAADGLDILRWLSGQPDRGITMEDFIFGEILKDVPEPTGGATAFALARID